MQSRRKFISGAIALATVSTLPTLAGAARKQPKIMVYKTRTCGCCQAWVTHLQDNGFTVSAQNVTAGQLSQIKSRLGIDPQLASCHTAQVDDYVVEGHVPATDIYRLLAEKPTARGLTVPGMPMGSPGMDFGPEREKYATLLIGHDGKARIFNRHN